MFKNAYIPYGGYFSTPFAKWQGSLQNENSIVLAGKTSQRWFEAQEYDPSFIEYLFFGSTVIQKGGFYSAPYAAHEMGLNIPGQAVNQACATSTTTVYNAGLAVEAGEMDATYCMLTDRCSNAAHVVWPNPKGPGGQPLKEDMMMDNFGADPATGKPMIATAENVARENGFTKEEADQVVFIRYNQYLEALKNDREFQKKYMFPIELKSRKGSRLIEEDEGIFKTTEELVKKLKPVMDGGIHSGAAQTYPADGNAGIIVANKEKSLELSKDKNIPIQIIGYASARTKKAFMPQAATESAKLVLEKTGVKKEEITTIKNHSPFAANDLYLAQEFGIEIEDFNNYGTSLIYGHPQGPTVARFIVEGIEETVIKGGGYLLVTGCAAGDSGAAILIKVG